MFQEQECSEQGSPKKSNYIVISRSFIVRIYIYIYMIWPGDADSILIYTIPPLGGI